MDDTPPRTGKPCPICGKPALAQFRPFCSARCRLVDLGRWLDGSYRVPAAENDEPVDDGDRDDDAPPGGEGSGHP
jgi:uncharacterized protein